MNASTYYEPLGPDRFRATDATVGPWDPRLQHGSPPAALLLHAIESGHPRDDVRVARIAYDFFGPVAVGELSIETELVRPGSRIELLRARLSIAGRVAMVASAWRIAVADGRAPAVDDPRAAPALPPAQPPQTFVGVPRFGYGESLDCRFVSGAFDSLGPATAFARPRITLLPGVALTPLERLLLFVDSANGISAPLPPSKFTFVPVELTVSVRRHPRTTWAGMSASTTVAPDGIGHTRAELFDEDGYLGTAVQTLFVGPIG